MRRVVMVAAVAALAAWPAAAQVGNPATTAPSTPMPGTGESAAQVNAQDELFVRLATIGGMAEVEVAQMAAKRADSEQVKAFARHLAEHHGQANQRLAGLAKGLGLTPPTALDAEHKAMRDQLEGADDAAFERAYVRGQIAAHQKLATLLEWELGSGQNDGLKRFAADNLPVVLDHLEQARALATQLTGQMARNDGPPAERKAPPPRR